MQMKYQKIDELLKSAQALYAHKKALLHDGSLTKTKSSHIERALQQAIQEMDDYIISIAGEDDFKKMLMTISGRLAKDGHPKHAQLGVEIQRVLASPDGGRTIATECWAMRTYAEADWTLGSWWKTSGFEEQRHLFITWVQTTAFRWEQAPLN